MLNRLTQPQHRAGRSRSGRRWYKPRSSASNQRRRERRDDARQHWHFRKLARRHEFNIIAFVPDALVNIKQRESQHPDRCEQDVTTLENHLVSD